MAVHNKHREQVVGLSGNGMVRNKGNCHKHGRSCDDEHVTVMEHAFGECGVVLAEVHCTFIEKG
jgi:hypothetical protein